MHRFDQKTNKIHISTIISLILFWYILHIGILRDKKTVTKLFAFNIHKIFQFFIFEQNTKYLFSLFLILFS